MRAGSQGERAESGVRRAALVALALLAQLGYLAYLLRRAGEFPCVSLAARLLALCAVIALCGGRPGDTAERAWIALILLFPAPGLCLYLLVGRSCAARPELARPADAELLPSDGDALRQAEAACPEAAGLMRYIQDWGGYPVYRETRVDYHAQGHTAFEALKRELRAARRFILMEYHAIEPSNCFAELEGILAERAAAGVEVRLLYDDVGSVPFLGPDFVRRMEGRGIRCRVFNPLIPAIRPFMNHRDHRKLTVIDGRVGFTGGYNLADEYFGAKRPLGHWKDTGLLLRGGAVRSLTAMFQGMWSAAGGGADAPLPEPLPSRSASDGWVQPFAASPLDGERLGENVYLNLLKGARNYAWIATPYLIPDDAMLRELALAAKRGVDVRVLTPGIPDKRLVFLLTRSYCAQLARSGVRTYEYAPGFLHAKQMLVDGRSAAVGTINLDYRSLRLHFEDAVLLHGCAAIGDIRRDFESTLALCRETSARPFRRRGALARGGENLLRLLAPML